VVTIGFNQSTYTVTEGVSSVSVMVDVQGSLARDVVVTLSTVDGTAVGGCTILASNNSYHYTPLSLSSSR